MSRAFTQLCRPSWNTPVFSKPFTRNTLTNIRAALLEDSTRFEPPAWASIDKKKTAAVLIPFCNVQDTPGILLQVRSRAMRSHSGEVSFPGGKIDETLDSSVLDTALRETFEELDISRNRIEILGTINPPEKSLRGDTVWPFVGFVHENADHDSLVDRNQPLASLDLSDIKRRASKDEVAAVFHLPLTALASRSRPYLFRDQRPYWAVDVSDLVCGNDGLPFTSGSVEQSLEDEVGGGREGRLEVWGLTGWYLNLLATKLTAFEDVKDRKEK